MIVQGKETCAEVASEVCREETAQEPPGTWGEFSLKNMEEVKLGDGNSRHLRILRNPFSNYLFQKLLKEHAQL